MIMAARFGLHGAHEPHPALVVYDLTGDTDSETETLVSFPSTASSPVPVTRHFPFRHAQVPSFSVRLGLLPTQLPTFFANHLVDFVASRFLFI
jgi:hypothetical protein